MDKNFLEFFHFYTIFHNILTIYIFNLLSHNTSIFLFNKFDKKLIKQAISRVNQEIYNN